MGLAVTLFFPTMVAAQITRVGEIDRIVESRRKKVDSTDQAIIGRSTAAQPPVVQPPLRTGTGLLRRDTLRLLNDIWMELEIDRPDAHGNAIVASAGHYRIDSLDTDHPLIFTFRQGRMSVNLASGRLGVLLKNKLVSIFGTEVFFQADSTQDIHSCYLKEGHVAIREGDSLLVDVTGKNLAWRWFGEGPVQPIASNQQAGLRDQMKYDTKSVWPRPFYESPWFWIGTAAVVGTATCYALECGPFDSSYSVPVNVNFPN